MACEQPELRKALSCRYPARTAANRGSRARRAHGPRRGASLSRCSRGRSSGGTQCPASGGLEVVHLQRGVSAQRMARRAIVMTGIVVWMHGQPVSVSSPLASLDRGLRSQLRARSRRATAVRASPTASHHGGPSRKPAITVPSTDSAVSSQFVEEGGQQLVASVEGSGSVPTRAPGTSGARPVERRQRCAGVNPAGGARSSCEQPVEVVLIRAPAWVEDQRPLGLPSESRSDGPGSSSELYVDERRRSRDRPDSLPA